MISRSTISIFSSTLLALALMFVSVFAAEVSIDFFSTKADGNNVVVEWRSSAEKAIARYEIERSSDGISFRSVSSVDAHGAFQSYRYVDNDVLMKNDGNAQKRVIAGTTAYRLKIVGSDNSISYSSLSTVVHNVSSVRRTWGMIKEMFK